MKNIMKLIKKYEEIIKYLIVGVLTTIISIGIYFILRNVNVNYQVANIISWVCAVTFAYFTNKYFVFQNKEKSLIEFIKFVEYRLLSLVIEIFAMYALVDMIGINDRVSKIVVQIIVQVLNYIFSKLLVFKKK